MFGVASGDAQDWLKDQDQQCEFLVDSDNAQTVELFVAMRTQWRVLTGLKSAQYQGLEYSTIPALLSIYGIKRADHAEIFSGLRTMESAALAILNKQ